MGFREAVTIAQCATFAVVLYAEPGEDRLGVDLAALRALKAMPSFLSLYDDSHQEVGRIFLLLDGVAVACRDAPLRAKWIARLRRNEDLFHVVRKETADAHLVTAGAKIDFAGVIFTDVGWGPRAEIPEPTAIPSSVPARALAARLGRVLWALRVRGAVHPGREGPVQYATLMELYSVIGVAAAHKWDSLVELSDTHRRYLVVTEAHLRGQVPMPWASVPRWPAADDIFLLATDAYPYGMGYVLYRPDGTVRASGHLRTEWVEQVDAEGLALPWAILAASKVLGRRPTACVIAVDADTVRSAANKGYARGRNVALADAFALCDWLVAVRVPGVWNAADAPSRDRPLVKARMDATWAILKAYAGALTPGALANEA